MDEELTVLKSIYLDELCIKTEPSTSITLIIYSNGDENDLDQYKRLLCVTFTAELPSTYPDVDSPKIILSRARGLSDEDLKNLTDSLDDCLQMNRGSCVLYECIELIRSKLSDYELPNEACAICLTSIDNRSETIRTNCAHFYHRTCLAHYVRMKRNELEEKYREAKANGFRIDRDFRHDIEDPVCRQILTENILRQLPTDIEFVSDDEKENKKLIENLSPQIRLWQQEVHALLEQQREKGGIIDPQKNQEIIFI